MNRQHITEWINEWQNNAYAPITVAAAVILSLLIVLHLRFFVAYRAIIDERLNGGTRLSTITRSYWHDSDCGRTLYRSFFRQCHKTNGCHNSRVDVKPRHPYVQITSYSKEKVVSINKFPSSPSYSIMMWIYMRKIWSGNCNPWRMYNIFFGQSAAIFYVLFPVQFKITRKVGSSKMLTFVAKSESSSRKPLVLPFVYGLIKKKLKNKFSS